MSAQHRKAKEQLMQQDISSKKYAPVGCVLMASGEAKRFGSNKLLADFRGQPMLCRALAAANTPLVAVRIVVTRSEAVAELCRAQGADVLCHSLPARSDTVRLGLSSLLAQQPELAGCIFMPCDQPLLRRESVEALVQGFFAQNKTERAICRLGYRAENDPTPIVGSPVLFGSAYFDALCHLPEGKGGSVILRHHPECVHNVYTPYREELMDADTPEALRQLEAML